jgi:hypothetical protein
MIVDTITDLEHQDLTVSLEYRNIVIFTVPRVHAKIA